MVFKLVRTDAEEPNKIQLPLGTHLIGRGKFLDCDDKRISRNHGHLIVTEDNVAIEALHQNPCFFTKKGSEETQVLKKACKETLVNGDKFGLLPGSYWYEVLFCIPDDADSQATDVSNTKEHEAFEADTNNVNSQEDKTLSGVNVNPTPDNASGYKDDDELNFDLNETVDNAGRFESPSLLDQQPELQTDPANQSMEPAPSPGPVNLNRTDPTLNTIDPEQPVLPNVTEEPKTPKRSHSPETDETAKKIKTEPVDVKQELLVKQEPEDGQAGPSGDGANQAGTSNSDDSKAPPPAQPQPPRERCIYGANCYRRNPVHKAQFSHPCDADWGSGDAAPCPYGAGCRKRDPRHWRIHTHPPDTRPPPPVPRPNANKRQRQPSQSSGSDSDSPAASLVVTTKRARKPLPKMDDSDLENEDPFGSDASDEWVPPSDCTETPDY